MRLFEFRFARRKEELDEELRAHLQMAVADRVERGETADEARQNAMREMGNLPLIEDVTRAMWGGMGLERVLQDVRYALRQIRRAPGFAITVVTTLALGLGATVAMYTVVDRVLLRPMPYQDSGELVKITEVGKDGELGWGNAFLDIAEWQARSHRLKSIAYYDVEGGPAHLNFLEGKDGSIGVADGTVSANLFSMLGVHAAMGRTFLEGENGAARQEDAHTILLSDAIWRNAFGADPHILGRTVKMSGEVYTVIGVMPRSFVFPFGLEHPMVWTPVIPSSADKVRTKHGTPYYETIARLAPGASVAAAAREMNDIQRDVAAQYTDLDNRDHVSSVRVKRYEDTLVDEEVFAGAGRRVCRVVADCMRERDQPAAGAGDVAATRDRGARCAGRWPGTACTATADRGTDIEQCGVAAGNRAGDADATDIRTWIADAVQHLHDPDAKPARAGRAAVADGDQRAGFVGLAGDRSGQSAD